MRTTESSRNGRRPLAGIFFLLLLASSSSFAQDDTRVSATWQVTRYDLRAALPQAETDRKLTVKAKLDLKNVSARPATTLTLRISPSAEVSAVTANGATVDYMINLKENSGLSAISPVGSQFLPLSFWYPTPNSWYFARGADYAPFRVEVTGPGVSVVSSGVEAGGAFEQKLPSQPYFVSGNWEPITANGVSVLLPKGSGAAEQKVANEMAGLAAEAKAFVANLIGPAADVPLRLVAVRRAGGFTGGGTILIDDSVFRRGRLDSQTAMTIAESVAKMWIGGSIALTGDGSGVIREGLTKYIATQFLESKFGKDIADLERQRQRVAYASVSRRDAPLTIVSSLDDYYYPEVANKGAMVWRILARKVGNDAFYKALKSAMQDGSASLSEIRSEFSTDKELLDHLFDQVTETNLLAGLPQPAGAETKIAVRNAGPVDVTVNVAAWAANGERMSAPTTIRAKSYGEIIFKTANKLNRVEIDPEKFYPQTDYSDDVAPREATDSDLLLAVKRSFDKQEYANAEKTARTVLRDMPRFDDVRVILGRSLLALGRNAEAEKEFRAVLDEKLPSSRSIAWAYVGLADIAQKTGQSPQAVKYAVDAIRSDAEYGASLAARAIRSRASSAATADESVKAFFAAFDKAAASNRKAELEALAVPGEASRFVSGIPGQAVEWKTDVLYVDSIDANNAWVETRLTIRLINKDAETGTAVFRVSRVGTNWKLSSVDIFEVR